MNNIIELSPVENEARVDSRLLADYLGIQHKNALAMIDSHKQRFEKIAILAFKTRKSKRGMSERYTLLNEDQAYLLLTFSKNTDRVADLKVELVQAFSYTAKPSKPYDGHTYILLGKPIVSLSPASPQTKYTPVRSAKR